jgi:heme oxygenase (biliverdin-producing, ferredoxin)
MRAGTVNIHRRAEGAGIVAAILTGRASKSGYALYLRNLLPVYEIMERSLHRLPGVPPGDIDQPALCRAASISADLVGLAGSSWLDALPLIPAGERYASRVQWACETGDGARLIGHLYTRYLGDLNGGAILRQRLVQQFGHGFPTAFTEFPGIPDVVGFVATFRVALDRAGACVAEADSAVEEAMIAFEMNIGLAWEVDACADHLVAAVSVASRNP